MVLPLLFVESQDVGTSNVSTRHVVIESCRETTSYPTTSRSNNYNELCDRNAFSITLSRFLVTDVVVVLS